MRLDKYLKVSRLIKRRTVANEACDSGRVLINDKPAKASANVKEGDIISISFGNKEVKVEVLDVQETVKKEEAKEQIIFMNRMWVMQAVFEGLIFSFIVAIGVLIDLKWGLNKDISWLEFIVIFAVLLSSVWLSAIEARRYARTQIREVILSCLLYTLRAHET